MTQDHNGPYLTGKLLLATPSMGDPRFHKAVIFICVHDKNGAMGLVVNHDMPNLEFDNLLTQIGIASDINVHFDHTAIDVMSGGPVEGARGFLLHSSDFKQKDTIKIDESYSVTGTIDALREVVSGKGPEQMLFILGYAGWGEGQLDRELRDNSWLVVDPDPAIIFAENHDAKWELAVKKLGIDPGMLSIEAGRA